MRSGGEEKPGTSSFLAGKEASIRFARSIVLALLLLESIVVPRGWAAGAPAAEPDQPSAAAVAPLADPVFDEFDEELAEQPAGFPDPFERVNRGTLRFNRVVDRWVLDPITRTYRFLVPDPARRAVRRFLANLNSPAVLVNDLLQREWKDGGVTIGRFAVNTTVGVAGIFDPASNLGWERHDADFGQTLALEGVTSGPFLLLPVLGPTTMRDGFGYLVDILFRPTTYLLGPADQIVYTTAHGGGSGLAVRDVSADGLHALEESSVDYYAALRNAYYQHRTAEIWAHRENRRPSEANTAPAEQAKRETEAPAL